MDKSLRQESLMPLAAAWSEACRRWADAIAIVAEEGSFTHNDVLNSALRIAGWLRLRGHKPGEAVVLLVANRPGDLAAFLGVWLVGGVVTPMHHAVPQSFILTTAERAGARTCCRALSAGMDVEFEDIALAGPAVRTLDVGTALLLFTSGSTGQPKGALLSHTAFEGKLYTISDLLDFNQDTRSLLVLGLSFNFAIWMSLCTLLRGGKLFLRPRFRSSDTINALDASRIDKVAMVPTMLKDVVARLELESGMGDPGSKFEHVAQILSGGEICTAELRQRVAAQFRNASVFNIYGLTETGTCDFFLDGELGSKYPSSIGRVAPGVRYRVVPHDGNEKAGELQIKTPYGMTGYLNDPVATEAAFCDGYFRTGDLARVCDSDVVEVVGRIKDVISRGGVKVYPREIELAFDGHPSVATCMAVGVPDARLGEMIHVAIVLREGSAATAADMITWVADKLERNKHPDRVHFRAELPVGATLKSNRKALRDELIATAIYGR